jgi:tetratricopeptide (TPR) repeat protein
LYLPSVGLCLLLAVLADRTQKTARSVRIAAASVLAIVLCAFSVLTFAQQRFYDNDITYTQQEINLNPANGFPYAMLANVYMDQGQTDLALKNYRIASERAPGDARISLLLSRGLFAVQQYTETETILHRLLLRTDLNARRQISVRLSLANVEIALGNLDSAQRLLQQVQQADPNFPELHWALGVLYKKQGQIQLAQSAFQREYQLTGDKEAQQQSDMLTMEILRTQPTDGSRP